MENKRMDVKLKQKISDLSYGGRILETGEDITIYKQLSPRSKSFEKLGRNSVINVIVEEDKHRKGRLVGINLRVVEKTDEAFYTRFKRRKAVVINASGKAFAFAEVEGFEGGRFIHQNANPELVVADLYVGQTIECDLMVAGDNSFISQAKPTLTEEEQELYDIFMGGNE